jgi:hypothetical protein
MRLWRAPLFLLNFISIILMLGLNLNRMSHIPTITEMLIAIVVVLAELVDLFVSVTFKLPFPADSVGDDPVSVFPMLSPSTFPPIAVAGVICALGAWVSATATAVGSVGIGANEALIVVRSNV